MASAKQMRDGASGRSRHPPSRRQATERDTPAEDEIAESVQYRALREVEKRLDATIARKRTQINDALHPSPKITRILRLWFTTSKAGDDDDGADPSWTMRIEGKIMDAEAMRYEMRHKRKLSSCLSNLFIQLAPTDSVASSGNDSTYEWKKGLDEASECDGFEITGEGTESTTATVLLTLDSNPTKFQLQRRLAKLLGMHTGTESDVTSALWRYIQQKGLQDKDDPEYITCDSCLASVLGVTQKRVELYSLPLLVRGLLLPAEPVRIEYTFDPTENGRDVFDISIDIDDPVKAAQNNFSTHHASVKEISQLDAKIQELTKKVVHSRTKRKYMQSFADNPKEFITAWIASQARDHSEHRAPSTGGLTEAQRLASYYMSTPAQEAVYRYNNSLLAARKEAITLKNDAEKEKKQRMAQGS